MYFQPHQAINSVLKLPIWRQDHRSQRPRTQFHKTAACLFPPSNSTHPTLQRSIAVQVVTSASINIASVEGSRSPSLGSISLLELLTELREDLLNHFITKDSTKDMVTVR